MTEHEIFFELLGQRFDGTLDAAGERRLREHLASCPQCRELYACLVQARGALDFQVTPPPELEARVMGAVRRENRLRRQRRQKTVGVLVGIASAAAILAVTLIPGYLRLTAGMARDEDAAPAPCMDGDLREAPPNEADDSPAPEDGDFVDQVPGDSLKPDGSDGQSELAPYAPTSQDTTDNPTIPGESVPPGSGGEVPEPADTDLVNVLDYIPDIYVDLRYATEDNFTGQVIYDFTQARLRYGTVKKLMAVMEELREEGYSLKIWDALRPVSAQYKLWEICPDSRYVANPNNKGSTHSRGGTVDLTLVYSDGFEVEMPSGFDEFSALADRDYSDVSPQAGENALMLERIMTAHGFIPYEAEWWHFTDSTTYDIVE